ncbi:hypothetical protein ACHQM5_010029 [Ranunculus cassubicifolius]
MSIQLYDYLHDTLDRIEQTTSVEAFYHQFQTIKSLIASCQPEIPESYFASRFVYGLKAEFQSFVFRFQPTTITAAYSDDKYEGTMDTSNQLVALHPDSVDDVGKGVIVDDFSSDSASDDNNTESNPGEDDSVDILVGGSAVIHQSHDTPNSLEVVVAQHIDNVSSTVVRHRSMPSCEVIHRGSHAEDVQLVVVTNITEDEEPVRQSHDGITIARMSVPGYLLPARRSMHFQWEPGSLVHSLLLYKVIFNGKKTPLVTLKQKPAALNHKRHACSSYFSVSNYTASAGRCHLRAEVQCLWVAYAGAILVLELVVYCVYPTYYGRINYADFQLYDMRFATINVLAKTTLWIASDRESGFPINFEGCKCVVLVKVEGLIVWYCSAPMCLCFCEDRLLLVDFWVSSGICYNVPAANPHFPWEPAPVQVSLHHCMEYGLFELVGAEVEEAVKSLGEYYTSQYTLVHIGVDHQAGRSSVQEHMGIGTLQFKGMYVDVQGVLKCSALAFVMESKAEFWLYLTSHTCITCYNFNVGGLSCVVQGNSSMHLQTGTVMLRCSHVRILYIFAHLMNRARGLYHLQSKDGSRCSNNFGITSMGIWLYDLGIQFLLTSKARILSRPNALDVHVGSISLDVIFLLYVHLARLHYSVSFEDMVSTIQTQSSIIEFE